jgi:hypothetical protein
MHLKGAFTHSSSCVTNQSVLLQLPSKTLAYGVGGKDSLPTRKGSVIIDEDCLIQKKKFSLGKAMLSVLAMLAVPVHSKLIPVYDMSG